MLKDIKVCECVLKVEKMCERMLKPEKVCEYWENMLDAENVLKSIDNERTILQKSMNMHAQC